MSLPPAERDPSVKRTLLDPTQAGAAILAWAAEGASSWYTDGLCPPAAVVEATAGYRAAMDPLRDFFAERLIFSPEFTCTTRALRSAYDTWAQEEGIRHPLTSKALSERLQARAAAPTRLHGGDRAWKGVGVLVQVRDTTQPGDTGDVGDKNSGKSSHARADEKSPGSAVTHVTHVTQADEPGF